METIARSARWLAAGRGENEVGPIHFIRAKEGVGPPGTLPEVWESGVDRLRRTQRFWPICEGESLKIGYQRAGRRRDCHIAPEVATV